MKVAGSPLRPPAFVRPTLEGTADTLPYTSHPGFIQVMTHLISLGKHPEAAEPLAKLYLVGRKGSISGRTARSARQALASAVGPGELASLLSGSSAIRVKPRSGETWEVVGLDSDSPASALPRVIRSELERQGISQRELASRAGVAQQTLSAVLAGDREPGFGLAVRIVTKGLGKPLGWLDGQLG